MKNIYKFILLFSFVFSGCVSANELDDIKFDDFDIDERSAITSEIETYIASIKTMTADFKQASSNGGYAEGKFYIKRPGKMKLEYNPPSPVILLADGDDLIFYDRDLDQTSTIDIDRTPASVLLKKEIKFNSKDYNVLNVSKEAGAIEISLAQADDPMSGELTLYFSTKPIVLKQWRVRDAQDILTTVSLYNLKNDVYLEDDIFEIKKKEE